MPPPINPGIFRIVMERAKELAMEAAKAANKEATVEFIEELSKELAQEIVKQLIKRIPDAFKVPKQEVREDGEGLEDSTAIEKFKADDSKTPQAVMEGVKGNIEDLDKIISDILFGDWTYEPPVEEAKEGELSQVPSDILPIAGDCEKSEPQLTPRPAQEDLVQNLLREIESLQSDWMTLSLAEATESSSHCSSIWTWIIVGGIAVIIVVGGAVYLWYRWRRGNGGGAGNGGGGAGEDGDGAVVLLGQEDQAAADQAAHPPGGPVGLQILLCGSVLSSGPLVWRGITSVDGLLPTTCGARAATAMHLVRSPLPVTTTTESLQEVIIAAIFEELTLEPSLKEALDGYLEIAENDKMFTGKSCGHVTDYVKSEVIAALKGFFEELISNLSKDKEGKIIVDKDAPKLCKSEHRAIAGLVGTTLCV